MTFVCIKKEIKKRAAQCWFNVPIMMQNGFLTSPLRYTTMYSMRPTSNLQERGYCGQLYVDFKLSLVFSFHQTIIKQHVQMFCIPTLRMSFFHFLKS